MRRSRIGFVEKLCQWALSSEECIVCSKHPFVNKKKPIISTSKIGFRDFFSSLQFKSDTDKLYLKMYGFCQTQETLFGIQLGSFSQVLGMQWMKSWWIDAGEYICQGKEVKWCAMSTFQVNIPQMMYTFVPKINLGAKCGVGN